ncbi:MAG: sulfatase-like hydrolase/transferase [Planctomycetaceae bacterium]|nr:sulfatase-like hydrolase/transferase [Planctomycetaceae bacterium]MCB9951464.1 sulfatase-like hydrolase/transferase [Planctomycetaceae bacterium]
MTFRISRLATFVLLSVLSVVVTTRAEDRRPNILLILADDLGYGDVSCYNSQSKVATPHVDQLARGGMQFLDAHSPSTVCTPTRYSILTGRMAFRLNYRGVFTGAGGPCLITEDRLTLPQMLHNAGYATAMFGKWHVGMTFFDTEGNAINQNGLEAVQRIDYSRPIPDGPVHRGFDQFFGTACCPTTDWLYAFVDGDRIPVPPTKLLDRSTLPMHEWSFDCRPGMVAPDFNHEEVDMVFLKKSLEFLDHHCREKPSQPFFLFHSLQAVHLPSFPGENYQGTTKAGPHGDFIAEFDDVVGQLMQKLETLGVAENTLVILTSDNGPEVGTVINMREIHQHDGARPWRGMKRDNWEGGHRVPFIVRWPGNVKPGSVSEQTVCLTDIMATCASIINSKLPNDAAEDSFNFLPVLQGETKGNVREFTLHQTISLALAIRKGKWKFLDHKGSGGNNYGAGRLKELYHIEEKAPNAPGQLYDLETDPGETNNLYDQHPDIVQELKQILEDCKRTGRSTPERG